ncbi:MAG: AraC family transcriptional regulator [Flammeovirgaceae bacterium]
MKVVPFRVPQTEAQAFRLQHDALPFFYDKLHQHAEMQLMLIESGEGTVIAGNYVGRFQAGDVFVLGSHQPHVFRSDKGYYSKKSNRTSRSISIYFHEEYFGQRFWNTQDMKATRLLFTRAKKGFRVTGNTRTISAQHMRQLCDAKLDDRLVLFFKLLSDLAKSKELKALNKHPAPVSVVESKRMDDILQFTFKESHRKIYIHEVAEVAHLSSEAFCRYFKLQTRKTYTNFLNDVRVSNACQLLANHDNKIEEVCFETGFQNISNFNRIFKKTMGVTPSRYARFHEL